MNRRDFLRTTALAAPALALGTQRTLASEPNPQSKIQNPQSAAAPAAATVRPGPKPNILYIIMEDCGPNYECYGEPLVRTPHTNALAAAGIKFTNTFCAVPVCSASRSALMSGLHPIATGSHNHRTWDWDQKKLPAPAKHLCDWFRDAGYYTCNLKGPKTIPAFAKNVPDKQVPETTGSAGNGKIDLNFPIETPHKDNPFDGSDWNGRAPNQPFFAHITIFETHSGKGWDIADLQPPAERIDRSKLQLPPYYPDDPIARNEYARYLDSIHMCDGFLGELLARLEKDGLAKNTIVVLSSDHGPMFRGKQFLYDGGLRIPLIIRYPDHRAANTTRDDLVSGVDIAPTLLGLAGIELPKGATHGRDVFNKQIQAPDHIYAARDRMDETVDRMRAVRTKRYKYIKNYLPGCPYMQYNKYKETNYATWRLVKKLSAAGKLTGPAALFAAQRKPIEELYDIEADPHEINNLANDPAHAATLKKMRKLVDTWTRDMNDQGRYIEDPVNTYLGYNGYLPEDTPKKKQSSSDRAKASKKKP